MNPASLPEAPVRPLRVGGVELEANVAFAPMSGISNLPARLIAREAGAALVFSETVSAQALLRGGRETARKLRSAPGEWPVAFQLFGGEPTTLGVAAGLLAERGAAWVDLNLGCPVERFVRKGAGAALLRDPARVARIVAAMRRHFPGVLSVKMRSGWDSASVNAPEVARVAVAEGVDCVTVHGRTRAQQYRGRADRRTVRAVVEAVPGIPVFANGDVARPEQVAEILAETGAAGVMIGRAAVGNPWIFRGARAGPNDRRSQPRRAERLATLERHLTLLARTCDDARARTVQLKRYAAAYSKGLPGGRLFREAALAEDDPDRIATLARAFLRDEREAA